MDRNQIMRELREIIVNNLEISLKEQLEENDRLYEDLNIDSIMVLQLMVYVEESFGVTVPDEDVDPAVFQKIGSFVSFIQELQSVQVQS